jgi:Family of unknown function (DUF5681)
MSTEQSQAHLWKKGQSGNPLGRPPGSARRQKLIDKWLLPHGGTDVLSPAEADLLLVAADLFLLKGKDRRAEGPVRIAHRIETIMAKVGLLGHVTTTGGTEPDAPADGAPEVSARDHVMALVAEASKK